MRYKELDCVVAAREFAPEAGGEGERVPEGTVGAVVEVLQDNTGYCYLVEFVLPSGRTLAVLELQDEDLRPYPKAA